jgi:hypothetical protein
MKAKKKANKKVSMVARTKRGPIRVRLPANPSLDARAEAAQFVDTLDANKQIARGKTLTPGTTHKIQTTAKGKKILVRKRFSAL